LYEPSPPYTVRAGPEREIWYGGYIAISCSVKTVELGKSVRNDRPWHIHVKKSQPD